MKGARTSSEEVPLLCANLPADTHSNGLPTGSDSKHEVVREKGICILDLHSSFNSIIYVNAGAAGEVRPLSGPAQEV